MFAVKKLAVISRVQPNGDAEVERITAENHSRRRAEEEAKAWEQFTAERARKAERQANLRSWMLIGTMLSFTLFGAATSVVAYFAAMGDMEYLSSSFIFLLISLLAGLFCMAKLER